MPTSSPSPGIVVLLGSGETTSSGRKAFDLAMAPLPPRPRCAFLETPSGFELNSSQVIGRVADFVEHHLQNYHPRISIVPATRRGSPSSPDDHEIVSGILEADLIFMGAGSPSYAVRQLKDSLAWHYLLARHRLGASLVFASAAVIAVSRYAIPVYEIFKVGEDPFWKDGLDLFAYYGLPLVFVPHWNNYSGGKDLDTSRCFLGLARFTTLLGSLPTGLTVIGIDEETALVMDLPSGACQVVGAGGVILIHTGHDHSYLDLDLQAALPQNVYSPDSRIHSFNSGDSFPLSDCCPFEVPEVGQGLSTGVWQRALDVHLHLENERLLSNSQESIPPPTHVLELVESRQCARQEKRWADADLLRQRIAEFGWQVFDTPEGPEVQIINIGELHA